MQQQITRGHQLQAEEGLGETLQLDLQSLETTLSNMDHTMDSQEQELEVSSLTRMYCLGLLEFLLLGIPVL